MTATPTHSKGNDDDDEQQQTSRKKEASDNNHQENCSANEIENEHVWAYNQYLNRKKSETKKTLVMCCCVAPFAEFNFVVWLLCVCVCFNRKSNHHPHWNACLQRLTQHFLICTEYEKIITKTNCLTAKWNEMKKKNGSKVCKISARK